MILKPQPPLYIQPNGKKRYWVETVTGKDRSKIRSKTFPGVARAMAYQLIIISIFRGFYYV